MEEAYESSKDIFSSPYGAGSDIPNGGPIGVQDPHHDHFLEYGVKIIELGWGNRLTPPLPAWNVLREAKSERSTDLRRNF